MREKISCGPSLAKPDSYRLYKPVSDWLEMLPLGITALNM